MNARYKPNGIPLTDYERELLTILVEECGEVIQAATKLLRFGKENRPPSDQYKDGVKNSTILGMELGDLDCMVRNVYEAGIVDAKDIGAGHHRKMARLAKYMQSSPP